MRELVDSPSLFAWTETLSINHKLARQTLGVATIDWLLIFTGFNALEKPLSTKDGSFPCL